MPPWLGFSDTNRPQDDDSIDLGELVSEVGIQPALVPFELVLPPGTEVCFETRLTQKGNWERILKFLLPFPFWTCCSFECGLRLVLGRHFGGGDG